MQAAAAAAAMGQSAGGLPDVWELVFRAALSLARSAAVDELLGATTACLRAYSRVCPQASAEHMLLLPVGLALKLMARVRSSMCAPVDACLG